MDLRDEIMAQKSSKAKSIQDWVKQSAPSQGASSVKTAQIELVRADNEMLRADVEAIRADVS